VAGLIDNTLDVMPKLGRNHSVSPDRVFGNTEEYFAFLSSLKRRSPPIGNDTESKQRARTILSALQSHIHSRLQTIHPHLLRCIIVHDDPNYSNILLDGSGNIAGVIDWESHSLQPMILAAEYPSWPDYTACDDPRFSLDSTIWLERREESVRLCRYLETVRIVYRSVYLP